MRPAEAPAPTPTSRLSTIHTMDRSAADDEPELITRAEAAELLGYSLATLATYMARDPEAWPRPIGKRGQANLYDREALLAAARPAHSSVGDDRLGAASSISDPDGLITCLYCGHRARNLGQHLKHRHQVSARDYRVEHKLPATGALMADGVREANSRRQRERLDAEPTALDHLRPYHCSEWTTAIAREAAETIRETSGYETVRARHAPGRRAGVEAMAAARARQLAAKVVARGFESVGEAIEATRSLPVREASARTGLSATTVRRWRQR